MESKKNIKMYQLCSQTTYSAIDNDNQQYEIIEPHRTLCNNGLNFAKQLIRKWEQAQLRNPNLLQVKSFHSREEVVNKKTYYRLRVVTEGFSMNLCQFLSKYPGYLDTEGKVEMHLL